jgi:CMP-N,N'-diacetyllegionaminic acid synthase
MTGVNHDYLNRKRRQNIEKRYLENGSFYIFRPQDMIKNNNRLSGRIGTFCMDGYKRFQIDSLEDFILCEAVMKSYQLDKVMGHI